MFKNKKDPAFRRANQGAGALQAVVVRKKRIFSVIFCEIRLQELQFKEDTTHMTKRLFQAKEYRDATVNKAEDISPSLLPIVMTALTCCRMKM